MIKRTLEISREPVHLSSRLDQLVVQPFESDKDQCRTIPAEDIGLVMVDQSRVTLTGGALTTLMKYGAGFVICGPDHHPIGMMLPLPNHTEVVWRIEDQIAASLPTRKRIWQQIVGAKIRAQAANLHPQQPAHAQLMRMCQEVKSGDSANLEAQAARQYWSAWLHTQQAATATPQASELKAKFRRRPEGTDPLNGMLNYGYAILRAAVARALISAGLFPALGLHHKHRANSFCLADDLMEPLRPLIDRRVRWLAQQERITLDQSNKAILLQVLTETVLTNGLQGPLMVALPRMTASLIAFMRKETQTLTIPIALPWPDRETDQQAG